MTKVKKLTLLLIAIFVMSLTLVFGVGCSPTDTSEGKGIAEQAVEETEGKSKRMFTSLSIAIDSGNGTVWTTVRNDFTLFPAKVNVVVELYFSREYTAAYENMTKVEYNNINDLNIYQSISATATITEEGYWHGVAIYKVDNGAWKIMSTGTARFSSTGEYLGTV